MKSNPMAGTVKMLNPLLDSTNSGEEENEDGKPVTRIKKGDTMTVSLTSGSEPSGDAAAEPGEATVAALGDSRFGILLIQTVISFVFAPVAFFWLITIMSDIFINRVGTCAEGDTNCHKWPITGLHFWVLIVCPALSFWGSCYMLLQYWMDEKSWTLLRKRVMFANIPMCIFFAVVLMGQSEYHRMGMGCAQMGFILQVTYLMMNLWHTMTVITAYRFICLEQGRLKGQWRAAVHAACWGFPILSTTVMTILYTAFSSDTSPSMFHDDIFEDPDIRGIGWCGVKSSNRFLKALFVNSPQLIAVSLYAQYYSYIHDYIDPDPDADPSNASSRVSTSRNAGLMGAAEVRKTEYNQDLAKQLRMYMTAYMMSFLTNTVLQVIGDNMAIGAPSDANLLLQSIVVTPQGFVWALVYMQTCPNSLFGAYLDVAMNFLESKGKTDLVRKIKGIRDKSKQAAESGLSKAGENAGALDKFKNGLVVFMQSFLMLPVAVWVWTPMEFLGEQLKSRWSIFIGLCVWGVVTVFPFYWFAIQPEGVSVNPFLYSAAAQGYTVVVIVISAWAVWNNRYAHYLVMIEGPVRRVGVFASIGQGYRLNSIRNCMGLLTLSIEFYQVWGIAWTTAKMPDRYDPVDPNAVVEEAGSDSGEIDVAAMLKQLAKFWAIVGMCGGWAILYSLPATITTTTVGNQHLAFVLMEKYRKYLWFMSGAGFLTVLKTLMKVLFCLEDPAGGLEANGVTIRQVALTDYTMECWSPTHLRMTAVSLICLILFFPSASLTCLFRYGEEDDRQLPCCKPTNAICFKDSPGMQPGMRLGGEDTRWIHIWKRAEYMVKGVWVFTAYKFSTYESPIPAISFLLGGSFLIAWMNWFMRPACLTYVGNCKLNVHVCNVWTTTTCLWAMITDNKSKSTHLAMLFGGWVFVWISIWGYEIWKYKNDVFRKPVGDESNIEKCIAEIEALNIGITTAKSLQLWGVHAKITRLLRFAEHEDIPVRTAAYEVMALLSYQDQMTLHRSFFLSITPTDPAVPILLTTIEQETDPTVRNLAAQTLISFLQMNIGNRYGLPTTYYQKLTDYDEERGHVLVPEFVKYVTESKDASHQIDGLLLLNQLCTVDSNHLLEVVDIALPLLRDRMESGTIIEQYAACQIIAKIANRFDIATKLTHSGIVAAAIKLFHAIMDNFKRPSVNKDGAQSFCEIDGKTIPLSDTITVHGHNLPGRMRELFKQESMEGGVALEIDLYREVGRGREQEPAMRHLMGQMLHDIMETVVEVASASSAAGRRQLLDDKHNALTLVKRAFDFPVTSLQSLDARVRDDLRHESLRAMSAFLKGEFSDRDIDVDADFRLYNNMIRRFKDASDLAPSEEGNEFNLSFDKSLSPLQRRKAHMMCAYNDCEHKSVGTGLSRRVEMMYKRERSRVNNPMGDGTPKSTDEAQSPSFFERAKAKIVSLFSKEEAIANAMGVKLAGYYKLSEEENFKYNWQQCKEMNMPSRLLELTKTTNDPTGPVMFFILDILLLLLEHRMLEDPAQHTQIKQMMIDAVTSDNVGISVMGATGAELIVAEAGLASEYGERKAKYKGGIKLFKWAGRMVFWIEFWHIHSGSLGFLTPEEELAAKEEKEAAAEAVATIMGGDQDID